MPDVLQVSVRREGDVGVVATDGYINNMGAEKVSEACDALMKEEAMPPY